MSLEPAARLACFGGSSLTFEATVAKPISDCGIGPRIEPSWFCLPGVFLGPPDSQNGGEPVLLDAYWNPASGLSPASFPADTTISVSGHFDDPAAATCHVASGLPGSSPETPSAIVLACRETFVVTAVH